jgi:hypothetical protein
MLIHSRVASLAKHHLQLYSLLFCGNVLARLSHSVENYSSSHRVSRSYPAVDNESYTDFHRPESHMDQHPDFEQVGLLRHGKVMTVATIESGSPPIAEIPLILPCFEIAVTNSIRIRKDRFIPRFHLRRRRRMTTYIFSNNSSSVSISTILSATAEGRRCCSCFHCRQHRAAVLTLFPYNPIPTQTSV